MKRKLNKIYLLLTFLLAITTIEGFATPLSITVSGITSPAGANGIYTKAGTFRADLTGYASSGIYYDYWTYTNAGTTYYLYLHQFNASGYYWNIDNDLDDQASVLFYNSDNGGSGYQVNGGTNAPIGAPVSPDLVTGWTNTYGTGVGSPVVTIPASAPTVTTTSPASSVTTTSASVGGNVTADGGATVTEKGVVYSLSGDNTNPQIGGTGVTKVAYSSGGTGSFSQTISSLAQGRSYHYNAYAINSAGTSYGSAISFTTLMPAVTSATYDASTGALVLTCTNITTGDTVDPSKITLTGEGGTTYTLTTANVTASSSTSATITLNSTDKAAINQIINKNGTSSAGGTTFNLATADDWDASVTSGNSADATNALTVSNVAVPAITSATYNASTGALVVTGTGFIKLSGATNDIDVSKLTLTGEGGSTYTLGTTSVEITSGTSFTVTLNATDFAAVNQIINKNGTSSTGATTYNLAAAEDWAAGADAAVVVADLTGNGITASNVAVPAITSATYNASTGALVVTGTGFIKLSGATNDIDVSKLTLTGEGGSTYTLGTTSVEITSGTSFTVTLNATDFAAVNQIINKNGTSSTGATTYNLAATEDWAAGADAAVTVADLTGNGITASNVAVPAITSATYNASTGALVVTGTGFLKLSGATNDIDVSKLTLTGEGGTTYTLTTTSVEITSGMSFTVTLSATDKSAINLILNKNGTSSTSGTTYNLAAAEDWATGADAAVAVADLTGNGITVSNAVLAPTTQASSIVFSSVGSTQMTIGWTNGNGANRAVFVKQGTGAITNPSDNTTYTASSDWASKGTQLGSSQYYCIYNNNSNSVTLTGLTAGTQYTVQVFEYNGSAGAEKYYTATATDNPKSQTTQNSVSSISRSDSNPTNASSVSWTVTFAASLTGLSTSNFSLSGAGVTGYSVSSVSGSGATYTVSAGTGSGSGTLGLNLANATGLSQLISNTLPYSGQTYTIDKTAPTASIIVSDNALRAGETSLVTITFSEAVSGFTNTDLTIANGTLTAVSSTDGNITWTATFTPTASITAATNVITLDNTGVTDAAGNAGSGTTNSNNYAIDTLRPTASIVVADNALSVGETSLVTITFSEAVSGFTNTDLTIANGTLTAVSSTDGNITWTATFTPTASITAATNVITLDNTGVTDAAGNAGSGTTNSNNYAIDTARPTASIVVSDNALRAGETSLVTITFSEAVSGFTNTDLTIANGTLTAVSSTDGNITWTATFTPTASITAATNVITLDNTGVTDAAGNAGSGTTNSNNYAIDTLRPTASIVVADNALSVGETSLVTITFSEAVSGFTNTDLTIANGTLTAVSSTDGNITWTATFTPTASITAATNVITLDNTGVTDAAGNAGSGTTDSNNYAIDTARPTASIVVSDNALRAGETSLVTITFSEAVSGFTNTDLTIANGTLTAVSSTDGNITFTATFTPTASITAATNVITFDNTGVTDAAGNAGSGTTNSNNYAIDTARPTASIIVSDNALRAGETSLVTITFSEAVTGFTNSDLTIANGTLTAVSSTDGNITWTATFTPTASITAATNVITLDNTGVTDAAGNAGSGTTNSNNYAIDTLRPTASIVVADNALSVGETSLVTITFSEAVSGFTNTDLTIANGTLTAVSSTDGNITWTATFTPTASITAATNAITLDNTGVTDAAGNAGSGTTNSNNYAIDTLRPTASIVVADNALSVGETSLVTITFSEAVTGFTNSDLTIANGTLTAVSSTDGNITFTATFTPTASITAATNAITLDNTGVTDAAGNAGSGTTNSNNYAIDTLRPTASIVVADNALSVGETSLVTITFSEAVSGFTNTDLTIANGTLTAVSSTDGNITWTATFTPTASITAATNVITLDNTGVTDAAGNAGSGTTNSNNYAIDTLRPTASIVVADNALSVGETSLVTITFSEAVSGFTNTDLTIANGTLTAVSSTDGNITFTATFTPTASITAATNVITFDNTGVTDAAGNAGSGTTNSNNYAIDTARPTASIVVSDNALRAGETSLVTITFSEAVSGFTNTDLTIANGTLTAVSSTDGNITWTATFTPTASITAATNVITLDNTGVTDAAGNAGSGTTNSNNYAIDTLRPTASIVVADNALSVGETSLVTITFSEEVTGFTNSDLTIANGTLTAVSSTDGNITFTATFTPTASITAATNVITLDNTGVTDAAGNAGSGTTDSGNYAVDTLLPTVSTVSSSTANGTYKLNDIISITVTFSEAVTVTGTPQLTLETGATDEVVNYASGSGTSDFTFTYTVQAGDVSSDLDYLSTTALALNSGTIKDAAGNNATLTLASPSAVNSLGSNKAIVIDGITPTVSSVNSSTANGTYKTGDIISIQVNFSEAVTVIGTPTLALNSGAIVSYSLGSGTTVLTFSYTVGSGESSADLDYLATNSLVLAGGTIKDAAGNDATLTLPTVGGVSSLGGQKNIIIAINPSSGGTIASSQAGCYPFNPTEITNSVLPSGHVGTLEYKWQSSTTSSSAGFSDIAGSNAATYDPGSLTVDTWYRRLARVDCMSNWTGAAESNVVKMTVNALPTVPSAGSNSYIYDGTVKIALASVGAAETVDWYATSIGGSTISAPSGTNVGTYSAYAEARNATLGCISATRTLITLDITPKALTITAEDKSKVYDGDAFSPFTVDYAGFISGENSSVLGGSLSFSGTATTAVNVGTNYVITPGGLTSDNYDITFVAGKLDITKKTLTITAEDKSKVYDGDVFSPFTVDYSGFISGENSSVLGGSLSYGGAATTAVNAGTNYVITPGGLNSGNYDITFVAGKLDITKKGLTITAEDKSKVYDDAVYSPFTVTYSGFITGESSSVLGGTLGYSGAATTAVNVGTNYVITPGGLTSGNYDISFVAGKLDITKRPVTVTAQGCVKIYDRTTYSSVAPLVTGVIASDAVLTAPTQSFDNKDVGISKKLTPVGLVINDGNGGNNYTISYVSKAIGEIAAATVIPAIKAQNKCYDGTDIAILSSQSLTGVIYPDDVTLLTSTSKFDNSTPGNSKTVTADNLKLGGSDALNYKSGTTTATTTADIYSLPIPTISGPASICALSSGNIYTTESGMNSYTWTVTAGGIITAGGTAKDNSITVKSDAMGLVQVSVMYTNKNGCSASFPVTTDVRVNPLPGSVGTINGTTVLCGASQGIRFSIAAIDYATSYVWSVPAGATIVDGAGTPFITVNFVPDASSGDVSVYATNACGSSATSKLAISVKALPAAAGVISGVSSVCEGTTGLLFSVAPIANAISYNWSIPTGASIVSGANTNRIVIDLQKGAASGTISVYGTNSCGKGPISSDFKLTVNTIPPAPVIVARDQAFVSSIANGNQWYFSSSETDLGTLISGETLQDYTPAQNGYYWSIVNLNGCSSDASNHLYHLMTGEKNIYNVYPIPNKGEFTVSIVTSQEEVFTIQIVDQLGVKIYEIPNLVVNGKFSQIINLRPVATGLYHIIIRSQNGIITKIIPVNK